MEGKKGSKGKEEVAEKGARRKEGIVCFGERGEQAAARAPSAGAFSEQASYMGYRGLL